jgi:Tfp pilus assembly protein FimT
MRRGITLLELLMVIVLTTLLASLTLPAIGALHDRLAVDAVTESVVSAHTRARLVAVAERRVAVLTLTADSLVVRVVEAPGDTVFRWRGAGPGAEGVGVTGMPRSVLVAPSGVAMGVANGTYVLTRGAARKQVVVSRYGRIRVL